MSGDESSSTSWCRMSAPRIVPVVLFTAVSSTFGCGGQAPKSSEAAAFKVAAAPAAPPDPPAAADGAKPAPAGADLPAERKIVFTGTLDVEVKDFAAARAELDALLRQYKAYFAKTEITGDSGKRRSGAFVIKVPVEYFQQLVDALTSLGNPIKNASDSQDVTEEFVDVSARVKNLKAEEEVLNKLLRDAAGRLEDVFKIREQIRAIRGDIERAEARVQALGKMAALSTITLSLRETAPYVAPTADTARPAEPPFAERASGTFAASVGLLRDVGEAVGLFFVALAPWLPVLAVAGLVGWVAWRRARRPAPAAQSAP